MQNLKEFKELIERYDSITLEEIEVAMEEDSPTSAKAALTGFGNSLSCTLCKSSDDCVDCTWMTKTHNPCNSGVNSKTYNAILKAKSPTDLLSTYRKRAKYMKSIS